MDMGIESPVKQNLVLTSLHGIHLHAWTLKSEIPVRGNIILVHGFKDYSERYMDFAKLLSQEGFDVYAFDLRGHARSEGERVYFEDIEDIMEDFKIAIDTFKMNDNDKPWFIMGHSAGGALVARYISEAPNEFAGYILSAPVLKRANDLTPFKESALRLVDKVVPHYKILDLPDVDFSMNPDVVNEIRTDPYIHNIKVPAHTSVLMLDNIDFVQKARSKNKLPFLILHSQRDKINNVDGSKEYFNGTPNHPLKEMKIYKDLAHDLFHDPRHEVVERDILNWLNKMLKSSYS